MSRGDDAGAIAGGAKIIAFGACLGGITIEVPLR